jgi:hypothetical protein
METFILEEVGSGVDVTGCIWLTLGFRSALRREDVLHLICPQDVSAEERRQSQGMDGLYVERFDQSLGCYHGINRVAVKGRRVEIDLNPQGAKTLRFTGPVSFVAPEGLSGFDEAVEAFRAMARCEDGSVVEVT